MIKRPLCITTVFYGIGIIIGLYLKISIVFFVLFIVIGGIFIYAVFKNIKYILLILILALGTISIKIVDINFDNQYNLLQSDEQYCIKAVVVSDVIKKEYSDVYEIEIREINGKKKSQGTRWLLNLKKSKTNIKTELKYGDLIEFSGNIEKPSSARNYMGFDYQNYLKLKKIYGNMFVKGQVKIIAKNQSHLLDKIFHDVALHMKKKIYKLLPIDTRELCIGILIGDRGDIKEEVTDAFRNSNLTHMLAVSGAHISYIIFGISIMLCKAGKKFSRVFTIVFLLFFMGITKFTPSVERASIMAILMIISSLSYRKSDIYTNLAISAIIILVCDPYAILDIGFQLSYGGTIGIVLLNKKISKWFYQKLDLEEFTNGKSENLKRSTRWFKIGLKYIIDIFVVTISANIVIIPIMAFQFNTISFTFWISNILAAPLLGSITILGFIVYLFSIFSMELAEIIGVPLQYCIRLLIEIANFCATLPFSSVIVKTPYIIEIAIYYFGIYLLFHLKLIQEKCRKLTKNMFFENSKNKMKHLSFRIISIGMIAICISITLIKVFGCNRNLKIYFVDVGQGDCTLIRTPTDKTILIDGGGSETGNFNVGKQIVLPYLLDRRITTIDYIMISHFDNDHVASILYLLENIRVNHIIISKQGKSSENYIKFKEIVAQKNIHIIMASQGDRIQIDKYVYFDILFPKERFIQENILNNNSIVAKLCYGSFSMLFTGDIEAVTEKALIEEYKDSKKLKSTILKVAHHGSKSSSIQEILQLIHPKIALIGVGANNNFGHPNDGVLERLEELRVKVYRTDRDGEIEVRVYGLGVNKLLKVSCKSKFQNKK